MIAMPIGKAFSRVLQTGRPRRPGGRGAECGVQEHVAKSPRRLRFPARIVMALLIAVLAAGCQERLSQRDAYFAPLSGLSASLHSETEHLVNYHRALQAARLGCNVNPRAATSPDNAGPEGTMAAEAAGGIAAHAQFCASSGLTHSAHGAHLNGYHRWVGDKVRPLPDPSETASSIGGS